MKFQIKFKPILYLVSLVLLSFLACSNNKDNIPITTQSDDAREELIKGRQFTENLRYSEASSHISKAIELDSNFALAYYYNSFVTGSGKETRDNILKAMELKNNVSEGEQLLIESASAGLNNNVERQNELLHKLVELYPKDEQAVQMLANFMFSQQNYDSAIALYNQVIALNEKYAPAYNQLGYIYRYKNNYVQAEEAFKKYIDLIPNDPNPYDSYAEMLMKMGKFGISIETYYKALEQDSTFMASYMGIAYNLCLLEKHKEAREELKEMMKIAETTEQKRQALFVTAITYLDEGNVERALDQLEKEYYLSSQIYDTTNMANDLGNQAYILGMTGKAEEAEKKYAESYNLLSNSQFSEEFSINFNRNTLLVNARIAYFKNDLDEAKKFAGQYYKEAVETESPFDNWQAHFIQGQIAMAEKKYEVALEEFLNGNDRNPYQLFLTGQAYEALGRIEKAREYYAMAANFNSYTTSGINYALVRKKAELKLLKLEIS